jgi:hypothetical protein
VPSSSYYDSSYAPNKGMKLRPKAADSPATRISSTLPSFVRTNTVELLGSLNTEDLEGRVTMSSESFRTDRPEHIVNRVVLIGGEVSYKNIGPKLLVAVCVSNLR